MEDLKNYQQQLSIPIPVFPPFKLRSSLIDKDPVIWEYLLADYITLFKKLLALIPYSHPRKSSKNNNIDPAPYVLTPKTINQLHTFLQSFLHESSLESTQVFSLGAINPNIRQNQHILKLAIFSYVKATNLINLKLTGASLWEFCKVYIIMANKYTTAHINQALITIPVIRKLVQGNIKSLYTSKSDDVSLIRPLQDYLGKLIASGKWKQDDSEILYSLLGQRTKKSLNDSNQKSYKNVKLQSKPKQNDRSGLTSEFSEQFVNKHWIEILEELYMNGTGVNAKTATQVMVLSLCSLSSAKILKLVKESLEVDSLIRLKKFNPLVSAVILSKRFNDMNPDLKEMLSSLLFTKKKKESKEAKNVVRKFDDDKIQNILDLFPQLTLGQIKTSLVRYNDNAETVIHELLEMDPQETVKIDDYDELQKIKKKKKDGKNKKPKTPKNVFEFKDNDRVYTVQMGKKEVDDDIDNVNTDFKKKNLERALALLYEADEDEPDDTYVDNEIVSGSISISDDGDIVKASQSMNSKLDQKLLQVESVLFGIYSSSPEKLSRMDRNSQFRTALRKETGWTDEQIEGWARMLQKNPKRFRMLEERLVYVDGSLNTNGMKSSKWVAKKDDDDDDGDARPNNRRPKHDTDKRKGGRPAFRPESQTESSGSIETPKNKNNGNFKAYMEKKKKSSSSSTSNNSVSNKNKKK